jgi:hypothetical protein
MVSEEEKRRILRERRAAKMKQAGERLGKITGERPGFEQETVPAAAAAAAPSATSSATGGSNRRISQTFEHDDPAIEDISKLNLLPSRSLPQENADDFQRVLQEYLKSEHHQHADATTDGASIPDPSMDLFNQLLSGAMQPPSSSGSSSAPPPQNLEEVEYQQKLIEFKKQQNDKFKAKFLLFKLITFVGLTCYFYFVEGYRSSFYQTVRFQNNYNNLNFFKIFMSLEVLFTSFYALKIHHLPDNEYTFSYAKILGYLQYIPDAFLSQTWRGRIRLVVKYLDLLQLILFDFSVVFVAFGLLSYLH